jgi:cytosine/adenosine deaminase-related metal-dependent hydrolase
MSLPVLRLTFLPPSVSWPPLPLPHAHSPQDIIVGRPRDGNDRVAWLGDRGRYAEALSVAEEDRSGADTHTHCSLRLKPMLCLYLWLPEVLS